MEKFVVRDLSVDDLDVVFGVYEHVNQHVAHGFLASRKRQFFENALVDTERYVALGVWRGHELVGYSLSGCVDQNPYRSVPWITRILAAKQAVYQGCGLVVKPEHQRRSLASMLVKERGASLARRGVRHFVGAIAVENLPSIGSFLGEGGMLIGLEPDEWCLNYIVYCGHGITSANPAQHAEADICDLAIQQQMFDNGWVAGRLVSSRSHAHVLGFLLPAPRDPASADARTDATR